MVLLAVAFVVLVVCTIFACVRKADEADEFMGYD